MINFSFIRSFVTITSVGSFKATADKLFITQPAVSQHIKSLERNIGATLFERQGRKVFLTNAGKIFLPYAENILRQYQEAKACVTEKTNQFNGTIRIATIYSIGLYMLQPIIRQFLKKYPQVDIHLEYHQNAAIYEMILNRSIDFGLVAFPQKRKDIESDTFAKEDMVLIQSLQRPTIKKKRVSLAELNQKKIHCFRPQYPHPAGHQSFSKNQ